MTGVVIIKSQRVEIVAQQTDLYRLINAIETLGLITTHDTGVFDDERRLELDGRKEVVVVIQLSNGVKIDVM